MKNQFLILFFLIFINSAFSQNESIKSLVDNTKDLNLDMWELVDYAKNHLEKNIEFARFFYYWIGSNIKYDNEIFQKLEKGKLTNKEYFDTQDYYRVYENRKGICAGYANLFQWFMDEIDIEVVIISGHIRDERNHYVELESDDNYRHAWNAIKINEKWLLVDTTWGTSLEPTISDFYFNMEPARAIITHYPEESKWQLLKKTLSLNEFNKSKFIDPIWFMVGYSDNPKLKQDSKYYYFVYRSNPNMNWIVNLLYSGDNLNFHSIKGLKKIVQGEYTYLRFNKSVIPEKAYFKVNLYNSYDGLNYNLTYKDVINFKI